MDGKVDEEKNRPWKKHEVVPSQEVFTERARRLISQKGKYKISDLKSFVNPHDGKKYHVILCAHWDKAVDAPQSGCPAGFAAEKDTATGHFVVAGNNLEHSDACRAYYEGLDRDTKPSRSESESESKAQGTINTTEDSTATSHPDNDHTMEVGGNGNDSGSDMDMDISETTSTRTPSHATLTPKDKSKDIVKDASPTAEKLEVASSMDVEEQLQLPTTATVLSNLSDNDNDNNNRQRQASTLPVSSNPYTSSDVSGPTSSLQPPLLNPPQTEGHPDGDNPSATGFKSETEVNIATIKPQETAMNVLSSSAEQISGVTSNNALGLSIHHSNPSPTSYPHLQPLPSSSSSVPPSNEGSSTSNAIKSSPNKNIGNLVQSIIVPSAPPISTTSTSPPRLRSLRSTTSGRGRGRNKPAAPFLNLSQLAAKAANNPNAKSPAGSPTSASKSSSTSPSVTTAAEPALSGGLRNGAVVGAGAGAESTLSPEWRGKGTPIVPGQTFADFDKGKQWPYNPAFQINRAPPPLTDISEGVVALADKQAVESSPILRAPLKTFVTSVRRTSSAEARNAVMSPEQREKDRATSTSTTSGNISRSESLTASNAARRRQGDSVVAVTASKDSEPGASRNTAGLSDTTAIQSPFPVGFQENTFAVNTTPSIQPSQMSPSRPHAIAQSDNREPSATAEVHLPSIGTPRLAPKIDTAVLLVKAESVSPIAFKRPLPVALEPLQMPNAVSATLDDVITQAAMTRQSGEAPDPTPIMRALSHLSHMSLSCEQEHVSYIASTYIQPENSIAAAQERTGSSSEVVQSTSPMNEDEIMSDDSSVEGNQPLALRLANRGATAIAARSATLQPGDITIKKLKQTSVYHTGMSTAALPCTALVDTSLADGAISVTAIGTNSGFPHRSTSSMSSSDLPAHHVAADLLKSGTDVGKDRHSAHAKWRKGRAADETDSDSEDIPLVKRRRQFATRGRPFIRLNGNSTTNRASTGGGQSSKINSRAGSSPQNAAGTVQTRSNGPSRAPSFNSETSSTRANFVDLAAEQPRRSLRNVLKESVRDASNQMQSRSSSGNPPQRSERDRSLSRKKRKPARYTDDGTSPTSDSDSEDESDEEDLPLGHSTSGGVSRAGPHFDSQRQANGGGTTEEEGGETSETEPTMQHTKRPSSGSRTDRKRAPVIDETGESSPEDTSSSDSDSMDSYTSTNSEYSESDTGEGSISASDSQDTSSDDEDMAIDAPAQAKTTGIATTTATTKEPDMTAVEGVGQEVDDRKIPSMREIGFTSEVCDPFESHGYFTIESLKKAGMLERDWAATYDFVCQTSCTAQQRAQAMQPEDALAPLTPVELFISQQRYRELHAKWSNKGEGEGLGR